MIAFTSEQRIELVTKLSDCGAIFKPLWNISEIYFTDTIPTACVSEQNETIMFLINPDFWESLSDRAQLFVICHEQLHIMLHHFAQLDFTTGDEKELRNKNVAADLSVNHMLTRIYGFEKTDLDDWEKFCWIETVFPDSSVPDNQTAKFYYALLQSRADDDTPPVPNMVDSHDTELSPETQKQISEMVEQVIEEQTQEMDEAETYEWISNQLGEDAADNNTNHGEIEQIHNITKTNDITWKRVFVNIPRSISKEKTQTHWMSSNRNHSLLTSDLILPNEMMIDSPDKVLINVYLDSSGSCIHHAKYFLESALSLPSNLFEVNYYGFGTKVYPLSKTKPYGLTGFNSESYAAVSEHVNDSGNLDAVFVFTDGYSPKVIPSHPTKWHWFLTPNGTREHIDHNCHTYNLAELHWKGQA